MKYLKIALGTIAVVTCLLGCVWILQGVNILPGSYMTGDIRWAYRGAILAIVSAAFLYWTLRVPAIRSGVVGTLGVLLVLNGAIWILQGINVLPGSVMTGDIRWAYGGAVCAVIGLVLLVVVRKRAQPAA